MAFFTPATSLEARSASDVETAAAAAAAAQRVVKKLLSPNIVVVGCINEDTTVEVLRLPAPGETVLASEVRRSYGGKGANQAVQAALLMPQARAAPPGVREVKAVEEGDDETGLTAAVKEKLAALGENIGATAKGGGVASAMKGWLSSISVKEEEDVAEEAKQLLLEKAKAGGRVALVCKLGDDEAGKRYRTYLAEKNIEQAGVFTAIKGKQTGMAFITVSTEEGGENTIAYVPGANEHLTQSDMQQPHIVSLLQRAKVVVCENGVAGSVTVEALCVAKAAEENVITIFTPAPVACVPREAFAYTDYVVVNAGEAQQLYDQLVPLPRMRDSAGHVYEEQQQQQLQQQKEQQWPSLHAPAGKKERGEERRRGRRSGGGPGGEGDGGREKGGGGGSTTVTPGKMLSPVALRERLLAVGTHAVEIHPAAKTDEAVMHAVAAAAARAAAAEEEEEEEEEEGVTGVLGGAGGRGVDTSGPAAAARQRAAARETPEAAAAAAKADLRTLAAAAALPRPATASWPSSVRSAAAAGAELSAASPTAARAGEREEKEKPEKTEDNTKRKCVQPYGVVDPPRRGKCNVIITDGARDCLVADGTQLLRLPLQRVLQRHEMIDTVGAGDSFVGALAFFLAQEGRTLKEAVEKAAAVASYSVQKKGASVSYADRAMLQEHFFQS